MNSNQYQNIPTPVIIVQQNGQNIVVPVQPSTQYIQSNNATNIVQGIPIGQSAEQSQYVIQQLPVQPFEVVSQRIEVTAENLRNQILRTSLYSIIGSIVLTIAFSIYSYYLIFTLLFCIIPVIVLCIFKFSNQIDYKVLYYLCILYYSIVMTEFLFNFNVILYILKKDLNLYSMVMIFLLAINIFVINLPLKNLGKYCLLMSPKIAIVEN